MSTDYEITDNNSPENINQNLLDGFQALQQLMKEFEDLIAAKNKNIGKTAKVLKLAGKMHNYRMWD